MLSETEAYMLRNSMQYLRPTSKMYNNFLLFYEVDQKIDQREPQWKSWWTQLMRNGKQF
jgi:hypothetical protein